MALLVLLLVREVCKLSAEAFEMRDVADQVRGCAWRGALRAGIEEDGAVAVRETADGSRELTARKSAVGSKDGKAEVDADRRGRMILGSKSVVDCINDDGGKVNDRGGGEGGVRGAEGAVSPGGGAVWTFPLSNRSVRSI